MGERIGKQFRGIFTVGLLIGALAMIGDLWLLLRGSFLAGIVAAVLTVFLFRLFWRSTARKRNLMRRGYHTGQRVGTNWVYEELHGDEVQSLELPLEYAGRGEYDIHIPS